MRGVFSTSPGGLVCPGGEVNAFFSTAAGDFSFRSNPGLAQSLPWPIHPGVNRVLLNKKALTVGVLAAARHPGCMT